MSYQYDGYGPSPSPRTIGVVRVRYLKEYKNLPDGAVVRPIKKCYLPAHWDIEYDEETYIAVYTQHGMIGLVLCNELRW